ncbi:unnamed protein product [Calicophoron daubneyi]|uniref:Uncharacterized protein n=1 Tax=Calicophoron daubneyi TaxID=300641 RepID=A0AAV2TW79_CALDB
MRRFNDHCSALPTDIWEIKLRTPIASIGGLHNFRPVNHESRCHRKPPLAHKTCLVTKLYDTAMPGGSGFPDHQRSLGHLTFRCYPSFAHQVHRKIADKKVNFAEDRSPDFRFDDAQKAVRREMTESESFTHSVTKSVKLQSHGPEEVKGMSPSLLKSFQRISSEAPDSENSLKINGLIRKDLRCKDSQIFVPTEFGSYVVPCALPKVSSRVSITVSNSNCCILINLDPRTKLETVRAYLELQRELIRIVYHRVVVVDSLENTPTDYVRLSLQGALKTDEEKDCEYEVTTAVEHSFQLPSQRYFISSARVKQNSSIVYITVPSRIPLSTSRESCNVESNA